MTFKTLSRATCLAVLLVSMGSAAFAQSSTQGSIDGTIFDATNALVGSATVVITNNATAVSVKITSDASGFFKAPLLEPGIYTVTITKDGFETYKSANVQVTVGQSTEVVPHLKAGAASSVVEVSAEAPVLNFDAPDFSSNLNLRALENVPVNNLRWSSLALTTPGVVSDGNGFGLVSVRGISTLLNNVLIDGADDNQAYYSEERGRTREAYSTPPAAIAEFEVNTGVYQAQFGRAAGAVINSVTKSGGNVPGKFPMHGQVYFSDRSSQWGAYNPYTTNTTCSTCTSTPPVYNFVTTPYKPVDSRKIWGGTAGGALIPDKLFWQYTFDQHHRQFPGTAKAASPSTFFAPFDATLPGTATCAANGYVSGNTSAYATVDSQICTLAARIGSPGNYAAGATAYGNGLVALLGDLGSVPRFGDQEVNMAKLDYELNAKNHVSFLYNRLRWDSPGGVQTQSTNTYAVDTFGTDFVKLDYGVAKLTSQITPRISNELLYQYGRELNDEGQQPYSAFTKQYLVGTAAGSVGNVPEVSLDSPSSTGFYLGSPYYSYRKALPDERKWQIDDTMFYSKGNHSFKFGVDAVHNADLLNNLYESNGVYTYSYISNFLADIYNEGKANDTCVAASSPVASASSATTVTVGTAPCYSGFVQGFGAAPAFAISTFDYGIFAQDTWKVSPRLTLELGVRYDYEVLPGASSNAALTASYTLPGGTSCTFCPYPGISNAPTDKNNIGPRLGFSYDVFGTGKTVLRGGYGMYYGRLPNGVLLNVLLNTGSPLGQYTASLKTSTGGPQAFPNVLSAANPPSTVSSYYFAPNLQNPMVHEFDLIAQQQLGKGNVLSISYLGALGRDLTNFVDLNLNPTQTAATITIADASGKGPLQNGAVFTVPQYTAYGNTALFGANATKYQNITEVTSNINSNYNALVVEVQNRSSKSIQYDVNYTWSHALDYDQGATTTTTSNNAYDPLNGQAADYGNSQFNVPDRVAGYVLYNFPNSQSGAKWVKYLANDWSFDSGFQAQSGLPYSLTISGYASSAALNSSWNGAGGTSFIPMIGHNTYKYPRDIVQDVRLQKAFAFTERYKGEARVDLYNVYNHQNVTAVANTGYVLTGTGTTASPSVATYQGGVGSGQTQTPFGTPTNSNSSGFLYTPREVQISFKFLF